MRCDECIPLLEDYVNQQAGETGGQDLRDHLAVCSGCAREYVLLRREQELYGRCELQVGPEFWTGVQQLIAKENESRAGTFASLFNPFRFAPLGAALAGVVVVAVLIGVWRSLESRREQSNTEVVQNTAPVMAATFPSPDAAPGAARDTKPESTAKNLDKNERTKIPTRVSHLAKLGNARVTNLSRRKEPDLVVAENANLHAHRSIASSLDAENARHVEQVEMLLRSFKNSRLSRRSATLDLTYESRLSKDLLAHNALLRRDAELAGDVPLRRLLERFEPFLLDIANLQKNSPPKEIRLVRDNLMKTQIIAALQAF
jgi:hypothetical protein